MSDAVSNADTTAKFWTIVRSAPLFADLDDSMLRRIVEACVVVHFHSGESLVVEGESGDRCYLLVAGAVEATMRRHGNASLRTLGPGETFGEISLIVGGRRAATVRACEPTTALALTREHARALTQRSPEAMAPLLARLDRLLHSQMRMLRLLNILPGLFGELTPELISQLEQKMQWRRVSSGECLFRRGDPPDAAYIVLLGRLEANFDFGEAVMTSGDWVGEMALLSHEPRVSTVYATRDTELARLPIELFNTLVAEQPSAMRWMTQHVLRRLQRHPSEIRAHRSVKSFAVVPARPNVDIDAFVESLCQELSRYGSVLCLDQQLVDREFGVPGIASVPADHPGSLRLIPWLLSREEEHDYLIYRASAQWSGWSARAIRQADQVLTVVDSRHPTTLGDNEDRLAALREQGLRVRCGLVLLHPPYLDRFQNTRTWLADRHVDVHYHLRRGNADDHGRLGRLLTSRAISLVLGGGGARSCAGIGVIRAMRELGIPIDAVAGTSMGAVIGAALSAGYSEQQMLDEYSSYTAAALDATLPLVSLLSAKRINRSHDALLGSYDIEDLQLPFFCVSTNLTRGELVVHDRGPASRAVRASMSIPGVFPPTEIDGDLLIDGGLFNNVPVDIMAERVGGSIVAVDVIPDVDAVVQGSLPHTVSGWTLLAKRLNPFVTSTSNEPNIINILMRSVNMGSVGLSKSNAIRKAAAVFVRPHVRQWNVFAFRSAGSIASQGYDSAVDSLRQWWSTPESAPRVVPASHNPNARERDSLARKPSQT